MSGSRLEQVGGDLCPRHAIFPEPAFDMVCCVVMDLRHSLYTCEKRVTYPVPGAQTLNDSVWPTPDHDGHDCSDYRDETVIATATVTIVAVTQGCRRAQRYPGETKRMTKTKVIAGMVKRIHEVRSPGDVLRGQPEERKLSVESHLRHSWHQRFAYTPPRAATRLAMRAMNHMQLIDVEGVARWALSGCATEPQGQLVTFSMDSLGSSTSSVKMTPNVGVDATARNGAGKACDVPRMNAVITAATNPACINVHQSHHDRSVRNRVLARVLTATIIVSRSAMTFRMIFSTSKSLDAGARVQEQSEVIVVVCENGHRSPSRAPHSQ